MKDFGEFVKYATANVEQLKIMSSFPLALTDHEGHSLTQENINLITQIAQSNTFAILSQYHEWLKIE